MIPPRPFPCQLLFVLLSIIMSTFLPSNLDVGDNVNGRVWRRLNHVHQHLLFPMSIIHQVHFHFPCKITHCSSPCLPLSHHIYVQVTMSTVGYGDIYCMTTLGRAFQVKKFCTFLMFFPLSLSLIRWCSSLSLSRYFFHCHFPGAVFIFTFNVVFLTFTFQVLFLLSLSRFSF